MTNRVNRLVKSICLILLLLSSVSIPASQKVVTAAQVNGTWKNENGEFKIFALGHNRLKVEFTAWFKYQEANGPKINYRKGRGVAFIQDDIAEFRPDDEEFNCMINFKFSDDSLIITEPGYCKNPLHVVVAGTYHKSSPKRPIFNMQ